MTMSSFAQENNIPLDISVAMHSECELDNNSKTLLKNKLLNLANSNNLTVVDYGAVAMIPSVTVLKETVIEGSMKNILFTATGALMSPMLLQQGESIPSIAHLVHISA